LLYYYEHSVVDLIGLKLNL